MLNLADMPIMQITETEIEQWHLARRARKHAVACAKAYRLLSEIMIYADEKRAVIRNPVHIKGAGSETAPDREALTPDELVALSNAIDERYRAMILLATFGALRWSESLGLQRRDVQVDRKFVTLRRVIVEQDKCEKFVGPLKARDDKSTRRVDLPDELIPVLRAHLKKFVASQPNTWLFEDPTRGLLGRSQFRILLQTAKEATSLDDVTFHVLRHTGATWFAEEGATVCEVMERLGHRSERMAMRYQHAAAERMRQLASGMGARLNVQPNGNAEVPPGKAS